MEQLSDYARVRPAATRLVVGVTPHSADASAVVADAVAIDARSPRRASGASGVRLLFSLMLANRAPLVDGASALVQRVGGGGVGAAARPGRRHPGHGVLAAPVPSGPRIPPPRRMNGLRASSTTYGASAYLPRPANAFSTVIKFLQRTI